jgi:uncharacterized protein (DUF1499 family)
MRRKIVWGGILVLVCGLISMRPLVRLLSPRPRNLGVTDGRLVPCPNSPNCMSTQATDAAHAIAPYSFDGSADAARERLKGAIARMPGATLVTENDRYLHYEFTSRLMGFVDDVEFLIEPETHTIQFRSASRLGYSDFGVNRKRMEAIRAAMNPGKP